MNKIDELKNIKKIPGIITQMENKAKQMSWINESRFDVIAHRGSHIYAPENTLNSINKASELGYKMVEVDLQLTKDNVLVLMHDDTIDRTTNGSGPVSSFTFNELQNYIVDENFIGKTEDEVIRVPSFYECAKLCAKYDIGINVDLSKIILNRDLARYIIDTLKNFNILDKCFFVPSEEEMDILVDYCNSVNLSYIATSTSLDDNKRLLDKYINIFVTFNNSNLNINVPKTFIDNGYKVMIYNCVSFQDVYKWKNIGVRFCETDTILAGGDI